MFKPVLAALAILSASTLLGLTATEAYVTNKLAQASSGLVTSTIPAAVAAAVSTAVSTNNAAVLATVADMLATNAPAILSDVSNNRWVQWEGGTGMVYDANQMAWHLIQPNLYTVEQEGLIITNALPGVYRMDGLSFPIAEGSSGRAENGYSASAGSTSIYAGNGTMTWEGTFGAGTNDFELALIGFGDTAIMKYYVFTNLVGKIPPVSSSAYIQQGSQTISVTPDTTNFTALAAYTNAAFWLVPPTNSKHSVTCAVEFSSARYITGVSYTKVDSYFGYTPIKTVLFRDYRTGPMSWRVEAVISPQAYDVHDIYWGYVSNMVVQTYDRLDMTPMAFVNDGAGIIEKTDSLPEVDGVPQTDNGTSRYIVNAASMRRYIDARKNELADHAWNRTPSGRDVPERGIVTIDEPLVQQGLISIMQSGDSYLQSADGDSWYSSESGSRWGIGPSGRVAFEIFATNRLLNVSAFTVAAGTAYLTISTNWVTGTPVVEYSPTLTNPQWLSCPEQIITDNGSNWTATCSAPAGMRFYRVVDPGGDNEIVSHYDHTFEAGITLGGVKRTTWPDGSSSGLTPADATNISAAAVTIYRRASASSATVTVSPLTNVYVLALDVDAVISNDLSGLTVAGREAKWELAVNFTATSALYSAWAANIAWQGGSPELTCTGAYRFAMSTADGLTVTARQTYPTVHEWHYLSSPISTMTVGSWFQYAASTNAAYFYNPVKATKLLLDYDVYAVSGAITNDYVAVTCVRSDTALASATASCRTNSVRQVSGTSYYSFPPCLLVPSAEDHIIAVWQMGVNQTRLPLSRLGIRAANELESITPPAGWR